MIQFTEPIADAYVRPVRNVAIPSTPGRQVKFLQGHAVIKYGPDLVAMMKRPDVLIVLTPHAMSWTETFFSEAGENVKAEVRWPETSTPAGQPTEAWDPSYRHGAERDPTDS